MITLPFPKTWSRYEKLFLSVFNISDRKFSVYFFYLVGCQEVHFETIFGNMEKNIDKELENLYFKHGNIPYLPWVTTLTSFDSI